MPKFALLNHKFDIALRESHTIVTLHEKLTTPLAYKRSTQIYSQISAMSWLNIYSRNVMMSNIISFLMGLRFSNQRWTLFWILSDQYMRETSDISNECILAVISLLHLVLHLGFTIPIDICHFLVWSLYS